jgi:lysozyme
MMQRVLRFLAAVALGLLPIALAGWLLTIGWQPTKEMYPVQGVDVSGEQAEINWLQAKGAGVDFAYIRAVDGTTRDSQFDANWEGAHEAGVRRGALHAFSLCRLGREQAEVFVTTVPRSDDALPVAIELRFRRECTAHPPRDAVLAEIRNLMQAIETHTGKPVLLLITRSFDADYHVSEAIPRNLWGVQSFVAPSYFPRPWSIWQASTFRRVAGFRRPVHWDVVAP